MNFYKNTASMRSILLSITLLCAAVFGYALYLQYGQDLMPCPMCIVQRYAYTGVAVFCLLGALGKSVVSRRVWVALAVLMAGFGAFTAGRQSWIQWNPPEVMSCGRDFYGMIEQLPVGRYVPLIFKGSGDCAAIDWTLFGLSIANFSFIAFTAITLSLLWAWIYKTRD